MASRNDLQNELETILGSRNVYYEKPETVKMEYPAILYKKSDIKTKHANDKPYKHDKQYEITVIDKQPDNPAIDKILKLPKTTYDRHYTTDNLHHDAITIYY